MRALSRCVCFALLIVGSASAAFGADEAPGDTKEDRIKAAERYLKVVPMRGMMDDMATEMAKNMPSEKQRDEFKKLMTEGVDISVLEKATVDSMVKHFTTGEINALANFYGSREGRSVMKKFGKYMGDVMPAIQSEVTRAMKAQKPE